MTQALSFAVELEGLTLGGARELRQAHLRLAVRRVDARCGALGDRARQRPPRQK